MQKTVKPELIISVLALVVAITSTIASLYFSRVNLRTNVLPALILLYSNTHGWKIKNIGNGPALNIMIAHTANSIEDKTPESKTLPSGNWKCPTRLYPLARDGEIAIPWVGSNPDKIAVRYFDVHDNQYTSVTDDDLTKIYQESILPRWKEREIKPLWERVQIGCR